MGWLNGKTALITGGGSGLGRALVARFIDEGATVGVLERDAVKVQALNADFGADVIAIQGDVTSLDDNTAAVAQTVEKFGKLDCLVGNAGVFDYFVSLMDMPAERLGKAFDELMGVNVKGYLLGAKAAAPELLKTRGCIIYTVSNAGFYPGGGGPIYTASKHAVVGVIRQLAHELAPKIRVNGVAPGGMRTELSGLASMGTEGQQLKDVPDLEAMVESITPLHMLPNPEDYCGPYVLLASPENARPIAGVVINTDGGVGVRGFGKAAGGDDL